jgi:hypothetical protein
MKPKNKNLSFKIKAQVYEALASATYASPLTQSNILEKKSASASAGFRGSVVKLAVV